MRDEPQTEPWDELEQKFFEAAPPDDPPAVPIVVDCFRDLTPSPTTRRQQERRRAPRDREALAQVPSLARRIRAGLAPTGPAVRALLRRGLRLALAAASAHWPRWLRRAGAWRQAAWMRLDAAISRFVAELPPERPGRGSLLVALAVLVPMIGLMAGTAASRSAGWVNREAVAAALPAPAAPSAAEGPMAPEADGPPPAAPVREARPAARPPRHRRSVVTAPRTPPAKSAKTPAPRGR